VGAVAVKISKPQDGAREMLLNEAKIYNAFSARNLHRGDVPIVPKFYCAPYTEAFARVSNGYGRGNFNLDEEERKCGMLPKFIVMANFTNGLGGMRQGSPCPLSI
jgi:hypothetical protein